MFMVVILHILGHGGLLNANTNNSLNYYISWIMEIASFCAVNIFALTTGYLMIEHKWKIGRIIELWVQVFFYSTIITVIMAFIKPDLISFKFVIKSLFPVCFNAWWYFTSYFALFFLIPFLNKLIVKLTKRQNILFICVLIGLFSFMGSIPFTNGFCLNGGYSVLWLVVLYIIGGTIKKYNFCSNIKKHWLVLIYLGCLTAILASRIITGYLTNAFLGREMMVNLLLSYTSPLVVLMAICFLLFFNQITFPQAIKKLLKTISPLSFAVYIIHEHGLIREYFISNKFVWLARQNVFVLIGMVLLSATLIFIICILIEWLRKLLFKGIGINKMIRKLSAWIDKKIDFNEK